MRSATALGILCLAAAPAIAQPWSLTFEVTSGTMLLDFGPPGLADPDPAGPVGVGGTFSMTIYDEGNGCIGNSDTFVLDDCDLATTGQLQSTLIGAATATIRPGSARFTDFEPTMPGHIDNGAGAIDTDVYLELTVFTTGQMWSTYSTAAWCGQGLPFNLTFAPSTSASASDVLTVTLSGHHIYEIGISPLSATLTQDFIVDVTGTVHVPEPALGTLVVLGLGIAGAWLRRRRR